MSGKHYLVAFLISLWGIVFIGVSPSELREASKVFHMGLSEVLKAGAVGVVLGLVLRVDKVRSYLNRIAFGSLLTGVGLGVVGLGAIGSGVVGVAVVYWRLGDMALAGLPMHAAVVGLSAIIIYFVSRIGRDEKI